MTPKPAHQMEKFLKALEVIRLAREETTVGQAEVFLALILLSDDEEKDIRQEDLGNRVGRAQGVISNMLRKFVVAGFLKKEIGERENEKVYKLTPEGRALVNRVQRALEG